MGVFRKRAPNHLIQIDADNAASKDWVILLEAGTIVGPSPDRLRVARSTLEKKVVRRYGPPFNVRHFLEVEGYDPRIHAVYFCPQLYKYDPEKKLVPLQGDEIQVDRASACEWRQREAALVRTVGEIAKSAHHQHSSG
jgi:hypothetical protein